MSTFITSDLHLGHSNIAGPNTSIWKEGYRGFESVEQMDDEIINNINRFVQPEDTLYVVGDFAMGGHTRIPDYRRRINSQEVHIILGNHDAHIRKYADLFASVSESKTIFVNKQGIYLHHYACRVWEGSHKGFLHAYGHSHGSIEHSPYGKSMDVGIDNAFKIFGAYRPFQAEEFMYLMHKRKIEFPDHHSSETNVR